MGIWRRLKLYQSIEKLRGRPLMVYVTSPRQNAKGNMAADAVGEIQAQLQCLPVNADAVDLLIVSDGGDPTVAWRVVSLIRERVSQFSVLIPHSAFSAATLVALGADEIVMHPNGNLGPVDPQIRIIKASPDGSKEEHRFGSEDLSAFLEFARKEVGLSDQKPLSDAFRWFCREVGTVPIGTAARGAQLSVSMGEKLLKMHMTGEKGQQARTIAEALSRNFFHHGYPVSRKEARDIGLKISDSSLELEKLLWTIWLDIEEELQIRSPFNPIAVLKADPNCAALFSPVPQFQLPANLPQAIMQQVMNQVMQQVQIVQVHPASFKMVLALVESARWATRFVTEGLIYGTRTPDLQIRVSVVNEISQWQDLPIARARKERRNGANA